MIQTLIFTVFLNVAVMGSEFPSPEFVETLRPIREKCIKDTGVDGEIVKKFSEGDMIDDGNLKCYMKCVFIEFEVLNPTTGFFYYERMLNILPESMKSIAYDMGHRCVHYQGEGGRDLCQVSYDLHRCWQKADPEHYFLI